MIKHFCLIALASMAMLSCSSQAQEENNGNNDLASAIDEVIMSRRSIRQYQDRPVSRDTLDIILKHGLNAPNGMNAQEYEVRVIDNPDLIKEMSDAVVKDKPEVAQRPGFKNIFVNAPVVVFIAASDRYDLSYVDCGLLGENIMLSAWSMGIGSCCLGNPVRLLNGSESAKPYVEKLNFSAGYKFIYCIGLGYPDEAPEAKPRKAEKVQYIN